MGKYIAIALCAVLLAGLTGAPGRHSAAQEAHSADGRVIAIVRFTPNAQQTPEGYRAFLERIMPTYQNADGLLRKYFTASDTGSAGVYEWRSQQHAEAFYDEAWRTGMEQIASDVSVEYLTVSAQLDNQTDTVDYYF